MPSGEDVDILLSPTLFSRQGFLMRGDVTKRTRGEIGYPAPRVQQVGKLFGGPIAEKMIDYAPVDDAALIPAHCAQAAPSL